MVSYKSLIIMGVGGSLSLLLASCASTPPSPKPTSVLTPQAPTTTVSPSAGAQTVNQGAYHTVRSGETLWRISKLYNVPVAAITQVNNLTSQTIRAGERLFIPAVSGAKNLTIGTINTATQTLLPPSRSASAAGGGFIWPVQGRVLTHFGDIKSDVQTKGIEIVTVSDQPIVASKDGVVSFESDSVKGYGLMIILDHTGGYQTVYAYNSQNIVKKGTRVKAGQRIAHAGTSGRTQQPMLHFEIRRDHEPLDPESFLR